MRPRICRSNNQWTTLFSVTLFAVAFVAGVSYASNRLSLLSLPSSPWPWRWPSSSSSSSTPFSIHSFNLHRPPPPAPPPTPKTALYSMFNCESDVCEKQNRKMNMKVSKLMKELEDETSLRRGNKRDAKLEKVEAELGRARVLIRDAGINHSRSSPPLHDTDYVPHGDIYRNAYVFHRLSKRSGPEFGIGLLLQ